jgi:hypothetical protein
MDPDRMVREQRLFHLQLIEKGRFEYRIDAVTRLYTQLLIGSM